jgi:2-polyprenyl-6-methoxyphenol hydroxylase-like FAD-dependent oxidoreductase
MRFIVAGGGVAGLASALAVARAGHRVTVLERDAVAPRSSPVGASQAPRRGIPHFHQPHAFLPRGRLVLRDLIPDVLQALIDAGADPQDVSRKLRGPPEPGDEDLVWLWARRPLIEWALRRAAASCPGVELRAGVSVGALVVDDAGAPRAAGVTLTDGEVVPGDVVVDALGRYRHPPGWPRADGPATPTGALYFSRYFELREGVEHLEPPVLTFRGDLGYMGFNTFRGDNRTYAVILLVPAADRELRALRHEAAWTAACATMRPLDVMTSPDYGRPITDVMPMGGLMNVDRTAEPAVGRFVQVADALCHTDPAFAFGLSFALAHAQALAQAADEAPDADAVAERFRALVVSEARERYAMVTSTDEARARRWAGEPLDIGRRDGCAPLFAFAAAMAAAPHDDLVLRRTVRRLGLLDRTAAFDADQELHHRIETVFRRVMSDPPPPPGPPRDELLVRLRDHVAVDVTARQPV